jgi:hypothetical protein
MKTELKPAGKRQQGEIISIHKKLSQFYSTNMNCQPKIIEHTPQQSHQDSHRSVCNTYYECEDTPVNYKAMEFKVKTLG